VKFEDLTVRFQGAEPYVFYFENVHVLLLTYARDDAKFVYRIADQTATDITLDFPGQMFVERVLDTVVNIFFVQVQEGEHAESKSYVLGSYFEIEGKFYGAYYERDVDPPQVVLFRLNGEAPDFELEPVEGEEYQRAADFFVKNYT
jgi:hypothetical protein